MLDSAMPLADLGVELLGLNPYAGMQLGILLLLATPLMRVATASVSFWRSGERRYSLMSLAVAVFIIATVYFTQGR
jgi:uncharacterized membrane protein